MHRNVGFRSKCSSLLVVALTISSCRCVDANRLPDGPFSPYNLEPRHNRLGYERSDEDGSTRHGPVLFPETSPPEPANENAYVGDPVDGNPYEGVVRKRKLHQRAASRFRIKTSSTYGDDLDVNVFEASTTAKPYRRRKHDEKKKDYSFAYKVQDNKSGDDFSHSQSTSSHTTKGEYRVKLPDGRLQIVSYTADKNGYNAVVKYAEDTDNTDADESIQSESNYRDRGTYEYSYQQPSDVEVYRNENDYPSSIYVSSPQTPPDPIKYTRTSPTQFEDYFDYFDVYEPVAFKSKFDAYPRYTYV